MMYVTSRQALAIGTRCPNPEAGRDVLVMYPAVAQKRNLIRSAAARAHEGP